MARAGRVALAIFFGFALIAPGFAIAAPAAAQAATVSFSTAEATPADAIAYLVTTTDDQSEQWRQADVLLDRSGVGEALEASLAEEMGGEDIPLDAFLGGEVAVVVTQTALDTLAEESMGTADLDEMMESMGLATPEAVSAEPEAQGFAVVIDARAPDTAWAGIREAAVDDGAQETTYEGTSILYAPPASAEEEGMATARVGDLILVSTTPADLHSLIDTADGRAPAVTTVPEFAAAQAALPSEYLAFAFVNGTTVDDTNLGMFQGMSELYPQAFSGTTIAASEPGFRMETVTIPAAGETLPPGPTNFESELVNIAPPDSMFLFSSADLGATGKLDAIGAILLGLAFGMSDPSAGPPADAMTEEAIAEQYEQAAAMLGINLQTEFFQRLAGEYGAWLSGNVETEDVSGLFVSGVDDPQRVADALTQLSFLIQGAAGGETIMTTREVAGDQVYVVPLGDEAGSTIEFGVIGDDLVIGNSEAVDRFAAGPGGDSLSSNPQFQAVMNTLPVEHSGLFYVDLAQAIPAAELASEEAEGLGLPAMDEIPDASEGCANYASQEEAQAAYDAAEPDTFDLDQDFDGQVCEDFFAVEMAPADVAAGTTDESDPFADIDYSAVKAFAQVSYNEDGLPRSSGILYIAE
jgi:Protein of unknown function (DUF3352)